jgi:chemotaxis response regulator CheB
MAPRDNGDVEFEFHKDFNPDLLGLHGNPNRNENGEHFLNLMREHDRAASTFFDSSSKHNTWRNGNKRPYHN